MGGKTFVAKPSNFDASSHLTDFQILAGELQIQLPNTEVVFNAEKQTLTIRDIFEEGTNSTKPFKDVKIYAREDTPLISIFEVLLRVYDDTTGEWIETGVPKQVITAFMNHNFLKTQLEVKRLKSLETGSATSIVSWRFPELSDIDKFIKSYDPKLDTTDKRKRINGLKLGFAFANVVNEGNYGL